MYERTLKEQFISTFNYLFIFFTSNTDYFPLISLSVKQHSYNPFDRNKAHIVT